MTLDAQVHPHQPGDGVYVRKQSNKTLKEKWKGPFQVPPATPAAIKGDETSALIQLSRGKPAPTHKEPERKIESAEDLKLKLIKTWKYYFFSAV